MIKEEDGCSAAPSVDFTPVVNQFPINLSGYSCSPLPMLLFDLGQKFKSFRNLDIISALSANVAFNYSLPHLIPLKTLGLAVLDERILSWSMEPLFLLPLST